MNILILTDLPEKKYQNVSFDVLNFYCQKNEYDLMIKTDYYHDYNYDYVVYISNECLILNLEIKLENYINGRNHIESYTNSLNFIEFIIFKNEENILPYIKDFKKIKEIVMNKKINVISNFMVDDKIISNYKNNLFLKKHKNPFLFIYGVDEYENMLFRLNDTILDYLYNQLVNTFYFNKDYFDNLINFNQYEYNKDVEIFNPNKKIAFVTMYTYNIKECGIQSEYNIKKYCEKNGYTYYIHRKSETQNKENQTNKKPYLLEKYIDKHEYVVWVDADVLIFDMNFKIENIFKDNKSFYCFKDLYMYLNDGFLIFKNDDVSKNILKDWINKIEKNNLMVSNGYIQDNKIILSDIIKNYLKFTYRSTAMEINIPVSFLNKNSKIIHFMSFSYFLKLLLMEYFNYIIFNLKYKEML